MPEQHQQIDILQYGRGLAALFVCLFHTNILVEMFLAKFPGGQVFQAGHSGVEFFFVLSGFIIFYAHRRDIGDRNQTASFFTKRLIRLLPMFWLTVFPLGVMYFLFVKSGVHGTLTLSEFMSDVLLIPRSGTLTLDPAWTLQHEMIFYVIFSLLVMERRIGTIAFVVWQIACLSYLAIGPSPQDFADPTSKFLGFYNFGFAFGILIAIVYTSRVFARLKPGLIALSGLAIVGLLVMYGWEWRFEGKFPFSDAVRTILYFMLYSVVILGALSIPQKKRPVLDAVLGTLGAASYVLYLTHEAVSAVAVKLINRIGSAAASSAIGSFILIVCACVGASIIIHWAVERPIMNFLRRRLLHRPRPSPPAAGPFDEKAAAAER